jgi:hypothetical protein
MDVHTVVFKLNSCTVECAIARRNESEIEFCVVCSATGHNCGLQRDKIQLSSKENHDTAKKSTAPI